MSGWALLAVAVLLWWLLFPSKGEVHDSGLDSHEEELRRHTEFAQGTFWDAWRRWNGSGRR
jgi:hypothetical protein